jgi:hypothetical protein
MKRILPFLLVIFATLAHAEQGDLSPFDQRVLLAKEAETNDQYKPYPSLMHKRTGKQLARTMRSCIAASPAPHEKAFVLVADINSRGRASSVVVRPENHVAQCFANGFASISYPKPPAYGRRPGFPVTMKIQVLQ